MLRVVMSTALNKNSNLLYSQTWPKNKYEKLLRVLLIHMYTVSQNKTPTQSFCDNFSKYSHILLILSLLHSTMNCGKSYNVICHLTSNLFPHYLAKFECLAVQLYRIDIQVKSDVKSFFTVNVYRNVIFSITCLCRLIYNITACAQNIRHQHADIVWVVHASCQWMRRWRVVQC